MNFITDAMSTTLDLAAIAVSGGVLAYQLICLQNEQRDLREAVNERLASFQLPATLNDDILEPLKASLATAVAEALSQAATVVPPLQPQPTDAKAQATPAASDSGLPDGLSRTEARRELQKELEALKADDIRARVRLLPPDQRVIFRRYIPSLDKARKDDLIAGLVKTFGL